MHIIIKTLIIPAIATLPKTVENINLDMNNKQNNELKQILHYLESHLQDQDNHLIKQDELFIELSNHLESQDRQLENLTK